VLDGIADWRADGDADREGWAAQTAALENFNATEWLVEVTQPTRVIHGGVDEAGFARRRAGPRSGTSARGVPRTRGAGHLCFVERSRTVNDLLLGFLETYAESEGE